MSPRLDQGQLQLKFANRDDNKTLTLSIHVDVNYHSILTPGVSAVDGSTSEAKRIDYREHSGERQKY